MKKLIILLLAAASFVLYSQDQPETAEVVSDSFPEIDESSLTFDTPTDDNQEEGLAESLPSSGIKTSDYFRMIFFLALVILVVWLFIKVLKKYSGNRFGDQDLINVMGSQSLTAETSLHVVEIENSYFLLGSSNSNISLLTEIKGQESIDSLKLKSSQQYNREGKSFWEMVSGVIPSKQKPGEEAASSSVDFLKNQRNRLKDL